MLIVPYTLTPCIWSLSNSMMYADRALHNNTMYMVKGPIFVSVPGLQNPLDGPAQTWFPGAMQSEEPNKVKLVHNCGIVFPANYHVKCLECSNSRTHLCISS